MPIYASTLARGLLGNKIKEHKLHSNPLLAFEPGVTVELGRNFSARPFRIGHSIPDAMGIALRTPLGTIVHTGDFKFDHTPVDGKLSDFHELARLGEEGVLCLMSDSTRAENPGYTPSEKTVGEAFRDIMQGLEGRVIVATFASNIARIQQVFEASATFGRKVAVIGRSMEQNTGSRPTSATSTTRRARSCPRTASRTSPTTSSRSRRPAPRASPWPASRAWPTATTASWRSSPATP